jgi:hypothetical protein
MAGSFAIEKNKVFDLSHKIIKQFPNRSGFVTFTVHNPENTADAVISKPQKLFGAYTFVDPFEDEVAIREKEIYIGQSFHNPRYITIENELYIDIKKDYALYIYLMLHPNNAQNPYRDESSPIRFWVKPEVPIAKSEEVRNDLFNTVCDTIYAYRADEKLHSKLILASNLIAKDNKRYQVTKSDTVETHKRNLLNFVKGNELEVYKALNDDRGHKLEVVFKALESNAIYFNASKAMWEFGDYKDSYLKVEVHPTEDRFEKLVDHLIATPAAFDKLKEMLGM